MIKTQGQYQPQRETTRVGENLYDVELLKPLAEQLETQEVELGLLKENVSKGHYFWIDRNGEKLGPAQVLRDWDAAQRNPAWIDHIESIKRANLDDPLWVTKDGLVFNGMHRLSRAFIDKVSKVKVKVFEELPKSAVIREPEQS